MSRLRRRHPADRVHHGAGADAVQDYPALADRLGCDPVEITVEREFEALLSKASPIQRRRFQKRLGNSGDEAEEQVVA